MARDQKKHAENDKGDRRNPALHTYLQALKEARKEGFDEYEAASIAEGITKRKHGHLPKEGR